MKRFPVWVLLSRAKIYGPTSKLIWASSQSQNTTEQWNGIRGGLMIDCWRLYLCMRYGTVLLLKSTVTSLSNFPKYECFLGVAIWFLQLSNWLQIFLIKSVVHLSKYPIPLKPIICICYILILSSQFDLYWCMSLLIQALCYSPPLIRIKHNSLLFRHFVFIKMIYFWCLVYVLQRNHFLEEVLNA